MAILLRLGLLVTLVVGLSACRFGFFIIAPAEGQLAEVGPLSVEILEPYQRIRLRVKEGEFPVGLDLEWRAEFPPVEEDHHFSRLRGRVTQDYRRYAQLGTATGSVILHGKRRDVSGWFAARVSSLLGCDASE